MIKVVTKQEEANCITHSGTFHADDVFSTAFLEMLFGDRFVFRTNNIDSKQLNNHVFIYDIGRGKFDHHQTDAEKRENGIPYCSFGLLWKEYGKEFLKKYDITLVDRVFEMIDKDLIEGIDADDNGIFPKIEAQFKVKMIPGIIKSFNPSYQTNQEESTQFVKACSLAKTILEEEVYYINGKALAEEQILDLLDDLDENTKYLVLPTFLPYEETILGEERAKNILFVAYPSNRGGYAIKTVPKSTEDKSNRMDFPAEWAGLEGEEIQKVSGIAGLTFCHATRFLVSCSDLESVYEVFSKIL
ncbi:MAG: MYG1 family protein [Bacilli bacterium]|nr:MYG1 family protein [Bacilli bacterium]